jgi:hypothetical protein
MTVADWLAVVDDVAALGTPTVQLIGGEPTTSPAFVPVLERALALGLKVEVFSNLYRVGEALWELFGRPGVTLATSYYSADPAMHDAVTGRRGSHTRTRANIVEALRRRIPIRVAVIDVVAGQDVDATRAELLGLGVPAALIQVDRMRQIGRGGAGAPFDASELCGSCGHGRAAVLPDGTLAPCTMARGLPAGDVREASLDVLLAGESWAAAVAAVPRAGDSRCGPRADGENCGPRESACTPQTTCTPGTTTCGPSKNVMLMPPGTATGCTPQDGSDCDPAGRTACAPDFDDAGV